jgi:cytosine/adenosine deaminase-related metal-dependent hydrolase
MGGGAAKTREVIDLGGRLVTPPLVEPHVHLDAVLTVGQPRPNVSGSLFEGIAVWAERARDLTVEDVRDRAGRALRWQLANGVQYVRSHVDVCDPGLRACGPWWSCGRRPLAWSTCSSSRSPAGNPVLRRRPRPHAPGRRAPRNGTSRGCYFPRRRLA